MRKRFFNQPDRQRSTARPRPNLSAVIYTVNYIPLQVLGKFCPPIIATGWDLHNTREIVANSRYFFGFCRWMTHQRDYDNRIWSQHVDIAFVNMRIFCKVAAALRDRPPAVDFSILGTISRGAARNLLIGDIHRDSSVSTLEVERCLLPNFSKRASPGTSKKTSSE